MVATITLGPSDITVDQDFGASAPQQIAAS